MEGRGTSQGGWGPFQVNFHTLRHPSLDLPPDPSSSLDPMQIKNSIPSW